MSDWQEKPLGDLLEQIIDHRGKTPKKMGGTDFTPSGVPVVSAIHIKAGRIIWSERERYVPRWMFEKWMPVRLRRGDVLLTSEAPLGEVAQVPNDDDLVLSQRLFALRGHPERLDSSFLRYFFQTSQGQERLLARASGTTVVGIRQAELVRVPIPVPPLDEQRRIAAVLGAFDDLIETNRSLETKMLRLAQQQWRTMVSGVPCDPLGHFYQVGLSGVWGKDERESKEDERCLVLRGRDLQDALEARVPNPPIRFLTKRQVSNRRPVEGEIWTAGSGTLGPTFPITARTLARFTPENDLETPVLYSNFVKRLVPLSGAHPLVGAAWLAILDAAEQGVFDACRTGTAMPNLDANALLSMVSVPRFSAEEHAELNALVDLVLAEDLLSERQELTRVRDELLPLLMSGRVRVEDVEGVV